MLSYDQIVERDEDEAAFKAKLAVIARHKPKTVELPVKEASKRP